LDKQLLEKIRDLKEQRNAVILAHNYQPGEIQDLADFCGDSLGLSIEASRTDAEVIIFCGVKFMAETAYILSPEKTVLLPEKNAGCPMANMISADEVRSLKKQHPGALVVCYVNSTAQVKAESDYCCTSANAVSMVESLPADKKVIFVPDQHLGAFIAKKTGRDLILWPGYCPTHVRISLDDLMAVKEKHPNAVVMSHAECSEPVKEISDEILSTGQMLKFVAKSEAKEFIVATEIGMIHALKKARPDAEFIAASEKGICPNMKKITVEKVVSSLELMQHKVTVADEIRQRAKKALERMIQVLPSKA
jgi:quinolinate synthase